MTARAGGAKTKRGRPTLLTPAVQAKVVKAITEGLYRDVAAREAGIGLRTLATWMADGKERPESVFGAFRHAVLSAEARAEGKVTRYVTRAARKDVKAAMWWLERKFAERWGRKDRHEVVGDKNAPLIPLEMLRSALRASRERDPIPEGVDHGDPPESSAE